MKRSHRCPAMAVAWARHELTSIRSNFGDIASGWPAPYPTESENRRSYTTSRHTTAQKATRLLEMAKHVVKLVSLERFPSGLGSL